MATRILFSFAIRWSCGFYSGGCFFAVLAGLSPTRMITQFWWIFFLDWQKATHTRYVVPEISLSWEKRRSAQRQFPMSPSRLSLHIHKERKAPPQPVMNGSSVNRGLSPLTLRITQKCLYVHHLSVSPRALFASDSWAISVRYRGSLCLSRNVIHFRRQTVVHSGGGEAWVVIMDEGQRTAGWGGGLCLCLCILSLVASRWVKLFILQHFMWYLGGNTGMMPTQRPVTAKFLFVPQLN